MRRTGLSLLAGCALSALLAAPAMGADSPAPKDGLAVDEVVVTARKKEERLQDVPISVNVQSGEALEKREARSLQDAAVLVPNLHIQSSPGNEAVYVRGIGSTPGNFGFEQSVGLFVDGVYAGRSRQFAAPFLDVARVEVLRGPQGALFGKNTSAGAVNIVSRQPTAQFEAEASADYTVHGDDGGGITGIVSGPLSDTLSARLAVRYADHDGWIRNTTTSERQPSREDLVGRVILAWRPTDALDISMKLEAAKVKLDGQPMVTTARLAPLTLVRATTPGVPDFDDGDSFNAGVTAVYKFANGMSFTSVSGYSRYGYNKQIDADFTTAANVFSVFGENFWQLSQEVRLASAPNQPIEWLVGAFYDKNNLDLLQGTQQTFPATVRGVSLRFFDQDSKTFSLFGQATLSAGEHVKAVVGLRQTWDDKDADQTRTKTGVLPPTFLTTPLSGSRHERSFDPSVQLQYVAGPQAMLYVSAAKGSKAGGFAAAQPSTTPDTFQFEGERSRSFEAGAKLTLLDRRLVLNVDVFDTKYKDLQVSHFEPLVGTFVTENAASSTSKGVEIETAARLASWLSFNGSAAYLDAKYDDYPGSPCLFSPTPLPTTCTQNVGGTRLPRAPKLSLAGNFDVNYPLGNGLSLLGSFAAAHRSGAYMQDNLDPAAYQKAYTKLDARLGVGAEDGRWELSVLAKNLTNEHTFAQSFATPTFTGLITRVADPGRTITLQAKARF